MTHTCPTTTTTPHPTPTPLALLNHLISTPQWSNPGETTLWAKTYFSVTTSRITRNDLLQALDHAALRFSLVVSSELHTNLTANLYCSDGLAVGEVAPCWNYHQEWSWRFACFPHFVAVLRSGGNVGLFLGVRELVEGRRAVGVGLVKCDGSGVGEWDRY